MTTTTAGKRKAIGWAVVGLLLLVAAAAAFTRPGPVDIPVAQLIARSSADAKTLASALPAKAADKAMQLQASGTIPTVISQISDEDGVSAVRVWSPSGTLLASSDAADATVATAAENAAIAAAHGPSAKPSSSSTETGNSLQTFDPALPDKSNGVVLEVVRSTSKNALPFKAIGAGIAGLALVCLIVALTALLTSSGPEPVSVAAVSPDGEPFSPAPAPPVLRSDPAPAPAAATVDAGEERDIMRLRQKLKTSEASRAAMETQMEQLRSQLRVGTQGSEQIVAGLDSSLASSQLRAHTAGEKLLVAENRAKEAEERAAAAEEALSRATPSDATARLGVSETEVAAAMARIATLEGELSDHQARARDAEARAREAEAREAAITEQVKGRASQTDQAEERERTLSERATQAEMRASNAEQALADATRRISDLEAGLAAVPAEAAPAANDESEALTQARMELARAQDLGEQALAKLEISENRAVSAEAQTAELRKQVVVAESRAQEAEMRAAKAASREPVAPPVALDPTPAPPPDPPSASQAPEPAAAEPDEEDPAPSAAPAEQGAWGALTRKLRRPAAGGEAAERPTPDPTSAPSTAEDPGAWEALTGTIDPVAPPPATPMSSEEPASPAAAEPEAPATERAGVESATDPGAWKALAKTLRRNALGDEAEDDEYEEPEEPTAPMTEDDRSDLRARLAKASAKKRRKPE